MLIRMQYYLLPPQLSQIDETDSIILPCTKNYKSSIKDDILVEITYPLLWISPTKQAFYNCIDYGDL